MILTKTTPEEIEKLKEVIGSMAMDLKRVALGLHRGSLNMAERFKEEALKRELELKNHQDEYLKKILKGSKEALLSEKDGRDEDILMYSTLFQNFALKKI